MPPLPRRMPLALPIPKVVRPRRPPEPVIAPVKVFAEAGLRTQTPPSAFPTASMLVPLFANTEVIWLRSVLEPRNSNVVVKAPVFALVRAVSTKGPLPEASIR